MCINYWYCQLQGNWKINDVYIIASLMIACRVWTCHFQDMNTTKVKVDIFPSKNHFFYFCGVQLDYMKIVTRSQIERKSVGNDLKEEKPRKLWRVGVASEPTAAFFRRLNQYWPQENAALQSWFKTEGKKKMPNLSSDELFSRLSSIKGLELGQTSFSLRSSNSSFARNYNCTCRKNPVSK